MGSARPVRRPVVRRHYYVELLLVLDSTVYDTCVFRNVEREALNRSRTRVPCEPQSRTYAQTQGCYSSNQTSGYFLGRKRFTTPSNELATCFVLHSWYSISKQPNKALKRRDAVDSIRYYFTHVVHGVSTFKHQINERAGAKLSLGVPTEVCLADGRKVCQH